MKYPIGISVIVEAEDGNEAMGKTRKKIGELSEEFQIEDISEVVE